MSVQFGRWNFDGRPVDPEYVSRVAELLAPYGPDGGASHYENNLAMLYRAFHTTKESRRETQPYESRSGVIITWDGRLDNRPELIREIKHVVTDEPTDVQLVAAAYEEWGERCFARLIGAWAVSIWEARFRSLILARDPLGTRHLYYLLDNAQISWSTILDPLVLLAGKTFRLSEEYVAGWLAFSPAAYLTPYVEIRAVAPACFLVVKPGRCEVHRYWDFDPSKRIRYRSDGEYEEHFRSAFAEAVRRRLRSDRPILAELSGGMDSSSIVCMGDRLMAQGAAETPRVDTVSYYDDSEPNWNERPYFTKVEEKRGRTGCHIAMGPRAAFAQCLDPQSFAAIPGDRQGGDKTSQQLADTMAFHGARVILSGLAGDEFTGGVPTPTPELSDLLVRMRLKRFGRQLKLWALATRKPWLYLVVESARALLPLALVPLPEHQRPAPWFRSDFVRRNHLAVRGYPARVRLWGALPSFAANLATLEGLRRELGTLVPQRDPLCERRYPFLDRDLLEFLFAIPREQLVRPGQRRSLMRRALAGIVPDDVLNRKRKAFVARAPIAVIQAEWPRVEEMSRRMALARLGIVSETAFRTALEAMRKGLGSRVVTLFRTLWVESWLRSLMHHGILFHWEPSSVPPALHMIPRLCSGPKSSAG